MDKSIRASHIEFIENDTAERKETIVADIIFFACIYQVRITNEKGKFKKVIYSAAENVLDGYRAIKSNLLTTK